MGTNGESVSKRTLTVRGRHTYDRIVETAAELMHRNGVRATSLDDVLRDCGAGKSQMYHYFGSKQDLLISVINRHWQLTRTALNMTGEGINCWHDVRAWLSRILQLQQGAPTPQRCPLGSVANELAGNDETVRARLDAIFNDWAGYLADGLKTLKSRHLLRESADPDMLAVATLASVQGGILLAYTRGDLSPLRAALDAAYEHLHSHAPASA